MNGQEGVMKPSELTGEIPISIWFRNKSWPAGTQFPLQALPWGKLMYSMKGLAEINIENNIYLSTPEYAIWLPVNTEHESVAKVQLTMSFFMSAPRYANPYRADRKPCG